MNKNKQYINWTKNELTLLLENLHLTPSELVGLFPNRSYKSVLSKKHKLTKLNEANNDNTKLQLKMNFAEETNKHSGTLYTMAAMKQKIKSEKNKSVKVKMEKVKVEKVKVEKSNPEKNKNWSDEEKTYVASYHYLPINILKNGLPNRTVSAVKNYLFRNNFKAVDEIKYNPHTIKIIYEFMESHKLSIKGLIELVDNVTNQRLSINGIRYMLNYTNENSYKVFDNVIKTIYYVKHHEVNTTIINEPVVIKEDSVFTIENNIKSSISDIVDNHINDINEIVSESIIKIQELTIKNSELTNENSELKSEKSEWLNEKTELLSEISELKERLEKQLENVEALANESKSRWSIIKKVFF